MTLAIKPDFPIDVIRTSRRKTASITIEGGIVQFSIPEKLSDKRLQNLIADRTPWIKQKLLLQSDTAPVRPKEYVSGESFAYLGRNYRLKLSQRPTEGLKLKSGQLVLGVDKKLSESNGKAFIRSELEAWYHLHAERRLREKAKRYAGIIGEEPNSVSLKDYKSRWGSCSVTGDIFFNWKIIIAPHRIVDYVVVHELCHLLEYNHSPKFWKRLERVIPDYLDRKNWLKHNGNGLMI
jgi:predicted metal-dependent hydrolase